MAHHTNYYEEVSLRFLPEIYAAAKNKSLDPLPLLDCLEQSRSIATGTEALLKIIQNNEIMKTMQISELPLSDTTTDRMLCLCINSLSLLNEKIEHLADNLANQLLQRE